MKSRAFRILTGITVMTMLAALAMPVRLAAQEHKAKHVQHYTITDLGTLPGGTASYAFDMNDAGWVAGTSNLAPGGVNQHAVLWLGGQVTDLGTLGGPNSGPGGPNASLEAVISSDTSVGRSEW